MPQLLTPRTTLNCKTNRILQQQVTLALLMLLFVVQSIACPVCFGDKDSQTTQAAAQSILVLLGVTIGVLGSLGAFALRIRRLQRMHPHPSE